ncbi:hypothetical protein ACFL2K_03940, partial [Candidatus Margulisiibacteriota bacterium]
MSYIGKFKNYYKSRKTKEPNKKELKKKKPIDINKLEYELNQQEGNNAIDIVKNKEKIYKKLISGISMLVLKKNIGPLLFSKIGKYSKEIQKDIQFIKKDLVNNKLKIDDNNIRLELIKIFGQKKNNNMLEQNQKLKKINISLSVIIKSLDNIFSSLNGNLRELKGSKSFYYRDKIQSEKLYREEKTKYKNNLAGLE